MVREHHVHAQPPMLLLPQGMQPGQHGFPVVDADVLVWTGRCGIRRFRQGTERNGSKKLRLPIFRTN